MTPEWRQRFKIKRGRHEQSGHRADRRRTRSAAAVEDGSSVERLLVDEVVSDEAGGEPGGVDEVAAL